MKKCFLFIFLFSVVVINANISIEVIYNNKNTSESCSLQALKEGSESEFKLLNKKFTIIVTSIKSIFESNKLVEFDFFEINKGIRTFIGNSAICCFPLHSEQNARVSYGQEGDEIQESFSFIVKEVA